MHGANVRQVAVDALPDVARSLMQCGGRMEGVYGLEREGLFELRYLTAPAARQDFEVWRVSPVENVPSLAVTWPLLGWHEREIMDVYGIHFRDHPEPRPLIVPEPAQVDGKRAVTVEFPEIRAEEVQELPFGPIRADVLESAEFRFAYVGEYIIHYEPMLFRKRRGMERRFEGRTVQYGTVLAERISGVGSFAHGIAYCEAIERAAECKVPLRAQAWRVVLAELERLYNHLHFLGHLANTTTLKVGEAQGKLLEERVKGISARISGSRFLRCVLEPGGLRRDLQVPSWLQSELDGLQHDIEHYVALLRSSESYLDRLITTGPLPAKVAFDQGATGPVERASGVDRDLRRDHPYAGYGLWPPMVAGACGEDANARANVRIAEMDASLALIRTVAREMPDGPIAVPCLAAPLSEGLGWSESPRGTLFYAVHIGADGRLARVKVKSPSFSNWRAFPSTVHGTNMMDYAINEASFGLSVAGCAR